MQHDAGSIGQQLSQITREKKKKEEEKIKKEHDGTKAWGERQNRLRSRVLKKTWRSLGHDEGDRTMAVAGGRVLLPLSPAVFSRTYSSIGTETCSGQIQG
jgi:hypothetical protein